MPHKGFLALGLSHGTLYVSEEGIQVCGFEPGRVSRLGHGYSHIGLVLKGSLLLNYRNRRRLLSAGDYFSVCGPAIITGSGQGLVISVPGYRSMNLCGGPLEEVGRLRYINGATDSLLVPPVRKGDPCLNHLHFPPRTVQTPHTHPTIRINVIFRGSGVCVVEEGPVTLEPGYAFVILPETLHSFNTEGDTMDVITFHPDSDTGMTDDDHPMLNRTFVAGQSANVLDSIRT